jgi:hypothetical protein
MWRVLRTPLRFYAHLLNKRIRDDVRWRDLMAIDDYIVKSNPANTVTPIEAMKFNARVRTDRLNVAKSNILDVAPFRISTPYRFSNPK